MKAEPKIEQLNIYPVKGCAGISVQRLAFDATGPVWDRKWMIVDHEGKFLSQRTRPQMAAIKTSIEQDHLRLKFGSFDFLVDDMNVPRAALDATVWKSLVRAEVVAVSQLSMALSDFLGQEARLVEFGAEAHRAVTLKDQPTSYQVRFADAFPWLLVNTASLAHLNQVLQEDGQSAVPMDRFRANIVVSGLEAFAEEALGSFQLQGHTFHRLKNCVRCPVITVDQSSGKKTGHEPLATLARIHKIDGKVLFGVNLVSDGSGNLEVMP